MSKTVNANDNAGELGNINDGPEGLDAEKLPAVNNESGEKNIVGSLALQLLDQFCILLIAAIAINVYVSSRSFSSLFSVRLWDMDVNIFLLYSILSFLGLELFFLIIEVFSPKKSLIGAWEFFCCRALCRVRKNCDREKANCCIGRTRSFPLIVIMSALFVGMLYFSAFIQYDLMHYFFDKGYFSDVDNVFQEGDGIHVQEAEQVRLRLSSWPSKKNSNMLEYFLYLLPEYAASGGDIAEVLAFAEKSDSDFRTNYLRQWTSRDMPDVSPKSVVKVYGGLEILKKEVPAVNFEDFPKGLVDREDIDEEMKPLWLYAVGRTMGLSENATLEILSPYIQNLVSGINGDLENKGSDYNKTEELNDSLLALYPLLVVCKNNEAFMKSSGLGNEFFNFADFKDREQCENEYRFFWDQYMMLLDNEEELWGANGGVKAMKRFFTAGGSDLFPAGIVRQM
jgi:hypothetical protein